MVWIVRRGLLLLCFIALERARRELSELSELSRCSSAPAIDRPAINIVQLIAQLYKEMRYILLKHAGAFKFAQRRGKAGWFNLAANLGRVR
jgi:hypothetical protein